MLEFALDGLAKTDLAAQAVGLIAMACALTAFANRCDRRFYLVLMAAHGLFCLHFLMLGALAGAGANLIAVARAWLARDHRIPTVCLLLMLAFAGMAALTVRAPIDLLAAVAPILSTAVMFALTGWRMRAGLLLCSGLWLAYNLSIGSWGGTLNDLVLISVNLVTIIRLLLGRQPRAA